MAELKRRIGAAIVLITHDLGVVAEVAEGVMGMPAAGWRRRRSPRCFAPRGILTRRACSAPCPGSVTQTDSRRRAQPEAAHCRLRVRRPLPTRHRVVPQRLPLRRRMQVVLQDPFSSLAAGRPRVRPCKRSRRRSRTCITMTALHDLSAATLSDTFVPAADRIGCWSLPAS
jgi:ABC-type microcin C transport system duplicated ATPase subunit YejF